MSIVLGFIIRGLIWDFRSLIFAYVLFLGAPYKVGFSGAGSKKEPDSRRNDSHIIGSPYRVL